MTNAAPDGASEDVAAPSQRNTDLGKSEAISHRLWLMIEVTGRSATSDGTHELLAERLTRAGCAIRPRTIKAHLDGTLLPTPRELEAYAVACEWYEGGKLLADDPDLYMKPLIQAELFLCENFFGMPLARGRETPHGMGNMSVDDLRAYRAELLRTGRLDRVAP